MSNEKINQASAGLVDLIRNISAEELKKRDDTMFCPVASVNGDGTLNLYLANDNNKTVISNVVNQCKYNFKSGDVAVLYCVDNRPASGFVIAKVLMSPERTIDTVLSSTSKNPVENKVIYEGLEKKQNKLTPGDAVKINAENVISVPGKQDELVSGVNIVTINGNSLLQGGNIKIGEGGTIVIDSSLSPDSSNAIQNKAVYNALQRKQNTLTPGNFININNDVISAEISVDSSGTSSVEVNYITIGDTEYKIGGSGAIIVDDHLDSSSENPVQNKVITNALQWKQDRLPSITAIFTTTASSTKLSVKNLTGLIRIDWGDGTIVDISDGGAGPYSHTYTAAGTYEAKFYGVTKISDGDVVSSTNSSFSGAVSYLTNVVISNSVTDIGYYAFYFCSKLTEITIPDTVMSIKDGAFSNCSSLKSITIPDSVTSIRGGAFERCSSLKSITIGNSVTSIGNYVFSGCDSLKTVYYNGTQAQFNSLLKEGTGTNNDKFISAKKYFDWYTSFTGDLILNVNSWDSSNNYFYNMPGVNSGDSIFIKPKDRANKTLASNADLFCIVTSDTLTFNAINKPTQDIELEYTWIGG